MKELKWTFIFTMACLAVNQGGMVAGVSAGERSLGEKLVRQLWAEVKAGNVEALEKMMAPGFQSVHADGARDRRSRYGEPLA